MIMYEMLIIINYDVYDIIEIISICNNSSVIMFKKFNAISENSYQKDKHCLLSIPILNFNIELALIMNLISIYPLGKCLMMSSNLIMDRLLYGKMLYAYFI